MENKASQKMTSFAWKISLFSILTLSCVYSCPPFELSRPCECIDAFGHVFVKCDGAKDYQELERSLKDMAGFKINRLEITNSKLKHIPYEPFLNTSVSKIVVSDSTLFYLFDMPLSGVGASSLAEFSLQKVWFDGGLDWTTLEETKNLEDLLISQTNLEQLSESFSYLHLPKLQNLQLEDDAIEYVSGKVFRKFGKLANLMLKKNMLKKFERGMLPHPTEIRFIDLRNNLLESFPKDIFDEMPKLNSLLLDGNRFVTLHKSYMDKIFGQLFFFSVADNPLTCDCELSWLLQTDRPFHLFGHCMERSTQSNKELKMMGADDFDECEL